MQVDAERHVPAQKPGRLDALQGLRGTAALLVVIDHALLTWQEHLGGGASANVSSAHFFGALGVQIFFVISGFVMVLSHGGDFGRPMAPTSFMLRRIGRIVPLYWLATIVFWTKENLIGDDVDWSYLVLSLLFVPHEQPGQLFGRPVYGLGWTLQYEMIFYLIFAAGLMFRPKTGWALIAGTLILLVSAVQAGLLGTNNIGWFAGQPIVLLFLAGMLIPPLRGRLAPLLPRRPGFAAAAGGAGLVVLAAVALGAWLGWGSIGSAAVIAVASCLSVSLCAVAHEPEKLGLAKRFAREVGDGTYSIYLTHAFALGPAGRAAAVLAPEIPVWLFVLLTIPLSVAVGMLVHRLVERPVVRFVGQRLQFPARGHQVPQG